MSERSSSQSSERLDRFSGAERLLRFSQRLMDWHQKPVTDDEIAEVLGQELVAVFRYAQARLEGKVRKVTLEPAFCHSADIAFRALSLGYPCYTLKICLLHDVVEDTAGSIADVPEGIADIRRRFSDDVAHAIELLTNRYQLIFKAFSPKVRRDIAFENQALRAFRAALEVLRWEESPKVVRKFETEFAHLWAFLETRATVMDGLHIVKRDSKYSVATHLERQVYHLYVDELVGQTANAIHSECNRAPLTALVVKLLDVTDNIRTSEISNRLTLYKLSNKAETLLDSAQSGFIEKVPVEQAEGTTIPALHRLVQLRLVDQLDARRRAVAEHFSETRFGGLVDFLADQTNRLAAKYSVPKERVPEIERIEDKVRQINRSSQESP